MHASLTCNASGHRQKNRRRDSRATFSPPPPIPILTLTHRAEYSLAKAALIHPVTENPALHAPRTAMFLPSHRCVITFVQTDRKTNRQRKDFNKGGGGSYLFIPADPLPRLLHVGAPEPDIFHRGCVSVRARVEEESGNSDGNQGGVEK